MIRKAIPLVAGYLVLAGLVYWAVQTYKLVQKHDPVGSTYGLIFVDTPEVYTRERLVNDRFEQDAWLRRQLAASENKKFGSQVLRMASSFAASQMVGAVDGNVGVAEQKDDATAKESNKDGKDREASESEPQEHSGPEDASVDASPVDVFRDTLAFREEIRNEIIENQLDDRHDLFGNTLYRFKFDVTIIPDFDTSAYAIIEAALSGPVEARTENRPDFNSTESFEEEVAALISWLGPVAVAELGSVYDEWLSHLGRELAEEYRVASRLVNGEDEATLLDFVDFAIDIATNTLSPFGASPEDRQVEQTTLIEGCDAARPDSNAVNCLVDRLRRATTGYYQGLTRMEALSRLTRHYARTRFAQRNPRLYDYTRVSRPYDLEVLPRVAQITYYDKKRLQKEVDSLRQLEGKLPPGEDVLDNVFAKAKGIGFDSAGNIKVSKEKPPQIKRSIGLVHFIRDLTAPERNSTYTYAVTPKERVQHISDAVQQEQAIEFGLSAQAASAETALGNVRQRREQMQSIRRQPLVVGFSADSGSTAGWLVGPRFRMPADPEDRVTFRHAPIQQALAAVVSVPSWWRHVTVRVYGHWRDEEGGQIPEVATRLPTPSPNRDRTRVEPANATVEERDARTLILEVEVALPHGDEGITKAFIPNVESAPEIFEKEMEERIQLRVGKRARVLIPGRNLWRSTVVTLGAQLADEITVLPNMEGIIAQFDEVARPALRPTPRGEFGDVPLTVWTSEGKDQVEGRIYVQQAKD
jgi:hypothetical protein